MLISAFAGDGCTGHRREPDSRGRQNYRAILAAESGVPRDTYRKEAKRSSSIVTAISLPRKRVLEEAVKLAHRQIVTQTTYEGEVAYERDNFYYVHRNRDSQAPEYANRRSSQSEWVASPCSTCCSRQARPSARAGKRLPRYDLFLCHASEDKVAIARSLYDALRRAGVTVWYDEAVLALGDSLRRKIDEGLSRCRFGLVILSPKFFRKRLATTRAGRTRRS